MEENPSIGYPEPITASPTPPTRKSNMLLLGIGAVLLLALGVGGGYLLFAPKQKPLTNQQAAVSPTTVPSTTLDETASWKTYNDPQNRLTFKYPNSWGTLQLNTTLIVAPQQNIEEVKKIQGGFGGGKFLVSTLNFANSQPTIKADEFQTVSQKTITVDNKEGIEYTSTITQSNPAGDPGDKNVSVVVKLGNEYLDFGLVDYSYLDTFNKILSTFKFTDLNNETANWKTYSNDYYQYSFKYPSNWKNYAYNNSSDPATSERFLSPQNSTAAEISLEILPTTSTSLKLNEDAIRNYSWSQKEESSVNIDGNNALKITGVSNGKMNAAVVFEHGGYIYKLQTLGDYITTLDQILSTFKFTN